MGFNRDIRRDGRQQLRGGVGLFAGRTPYVWISNQFSRNGIVLSDIQASGSIPFDPDPFDQPRDIGGASTQEVNLIDPDFEFPTVLRAHLAYDRQLPWWDLIGSAEVVHDLMYVPATAEDVIVTGGTWEQLDAFISSDPDLDRFRGGIVERNTSQAPRSHSLDLRLAQDIPVGKGNLELTFDVLNLVNLLDEESGQLKFVQFNTVTPATFVGTDAETEKSSHVSSRTILVDRALHRAPRTPGSSPGPRDSAVLQ